MFVLVRKSLEPPEYIGKGQTFRSWQDWAVECLAQYANVINIKGPIPF